MKSFMMDDNGDFVIKNNQLKMIEGENELLQAVTFTLKTNIREWFLNPEFGFDMFGILGSRGMNEELVIDNVSEAILQIERVDRIDDIAVNFFPETREVEVYVFFSSVDGQDLTLSQRVGVNV